MVYLFHGLVMAGVLLGLASLRKVPVAGSFSSARWEYGDWGGEEWEVGGEG